MKLINLCAVAVIITLTSCQDKPTPAITLQDTVTASSGIKDVKAAELVGKVMTAMGGEQAWDDLDYVSWTFFGARHLVWDKLNDRVRIESPRDSSLYLVDLETSTGKYSYDGKEVTISSAVTAKMKRGKSIWINDMYWLFMPFKLTDPGVTLTYLRSDTTLAGQSADVLELLFDNVGDTPQNKYEVYIDQSANLIKQWDFFADADQDKPSAQWPWDNYSKYDGLLLSAERSDDRGPSNVRVYDKLDDAVFESFDAFKFY